MSYRPDIEGLRALAILLVVASHAGIPGFSGGYIGVDIFFVLSGFLITGLLVQERLETGRLDFFGFYARRFRRLLPALLLVLAICGWLGWQLLPPRDQIMHAAAGAAAAAWISNMYFAFSQVGYFEPGAEANLFLHTWSLAVEEQFYLVWPILIMLVSAGTTSTESIRRRLLVVMAITAVTSLVLELLTMQRSAIHAFYLMPMRAWEFALGALVHLGARQAEQTQAPHAGVFASAGLALIIVALLVLDESVPYPGAWALLPAAGAALLLWAGSRQPVTFVVRALSLRPMQWLGHVSYSWYLWHWPILILGGIIMPAGGLGNRVLLVASSLAVATLSYRFVESPIRHDSRLLAKPGWMVFGSMALIALAVLVNMSWRSTANLQARHAPSRYPAQVPAIYRMGCDDWYSSDALKVCEFGNPHAERVAVVMGDSIGLQWFPAYERIFTTPEWRLLVITKSSCPMVDRPIYYARIGREYTECGTWRERAKQFIIELEPEVVVLGSSHAVEYSREEWLEGTRSLLASLSPHVGSISLIRSTPHLPFDGRRCLETNPAADTACGATPDKRSSDQVAGWIAQAAHGLPNVRIVDMDDEVCPQGMCRAAIGRQLVYRDTQHLDAGFVAGLTESLAMRMDLGAALQSGKSSGVK